jgi:hypothetical protein
VVKENVVMKAPKPVPPLPRAEKVDKLNGVGPKTLLALEALELGTVGDLADALHADGLRLSEDVGTKDFSTSTVSKTEVLKFAKQAKESVRLHTEQAAAATPPPAVAGVGTAVAAEPAVAGPGAPAPAVAAVRPPVAAGVPVTGEATAAAAAAAVDHAPVEDAAGLQQP